MDFSNKCRTCLDRRDQKSFTNIMNRCYSKKSFKDVIIMLVPVMEKTLDKIHCICENCAETLQRTAAFIQKCLITETTSNEYKNVQKRNSSQMLVNGKSTQVGTTNQIIFIPNIFLWTGTPSNPVVPKIVENLSLENSTAQTQYNKEEISDHDFEQINIPLLDSIKKQNSTISLHPEDEDDIKNNVTSLNEYELNVSDIKKEISTDEKAIPLMNSEMTINCINCSKSLIYEEDHVCDKEVVIVNDIKNELVEMFDENIFVASIAPRVKHKRDEIKKLEREKLKAEKKQASFICETCRESFASKEEFEFHLELHPPWICEQCGKGFVKKDSLQAHKITHNDPNSYICEICGKGFKDKGMLRVHQQLHENREYKCPSCPKVFNQKLKVSHHIKVVHKKTKNFQCTHCGKLFSSPGILDTHARIVHFKEKRYECNVCQKKFGRSDYLHNHMKRHTGEFPRRNPLKPRKPRKKLQCKIQDNGPCQFCGKLFPDTVRLQRHLETHEKRYKCQFCPLTYSRKAICKRHEKIHEGGNVNFFRCNVCWKRFSTKDALDEHMTCHNKPRYACDLCGKPFNRIFLMNHHKLMEHGDVTGNDEVTDDKSAIPLEN